MTGACALQNGQTSHHWSINRTTLNSPQRRVRSFFSTVVATNDAPLLAPDAVPASAAAPHAGLPAEGLAPAGEAAATMPVAMRVDANVQTHVVCQPVSVPGTTCRDMVLMVYALLFALVWTVLYQLFRRGHGRVPAPQFV